MSKRKVRISIIGDILVDRYFHVQSDNLSQEAIVPILKINSIDERLGGAGKVVTVLARLKNILEKSGVLERQIEIVFFGLIPVNAILEEGIVNRCKIPPIYREKEKFHCYKNRIVSDSPYQQLVRFDEDTILEESKHAGLRQSINQNLEDSLKDDAINITIVSDYDKGIINKDLLRIVKNNSDLVFIDPKNKPAEYYVDFGNVIFPNKFEYDKLFQNPVRQWLTYGREEKVIVRKLGKKGCEILHAPLHNPVISDYSKVKIEQIENERETISTVGAGDVFIASFALGVAHLINNNKKIIANYLNAAYFSNAIASLAVSNRYCDPTISSENINNIKVVFKELVENGL